MMTRLALLRHGHTEWNRAHRIQGRTDIPLDDEARAQLQEFSLPAPFDQAHLWSSKLSRARETAEILSGQRPEEMDALMEMDWGDWEGLHGADLRADPTSGFRDIEFWGWDYAPPNGESPKTIRRRIEPWIESLSGYNLAVCHIGVMRVILAMAWGWEFCGACPFSIKRNRLYLLERTASGWRAEPKPLRLVPRS